MDLSNKLFICTDEMIQKFLRQIDSNGLIAFINKYLATQKVTVTFFNTKYLDAGGGPSRRVGDSHLFWLKSPNLGKFDPQWDILSHFSAFLSEFPCLIIEASLVDHRSFVC
jgi:hypothetical protein